jgi:diketogulonate reductase-like aldo/keto reductase
MIYKTLNNNRVIPMLGLGVFKSGADTYNAVRYALEAGYRHIDTAAVYDNEEAVGQAVKDSGIKREEVFITSKVWTTDMRAGRTEEAILNSLRLLKTDYIDLYLIHWPVVDEIVNTYKVMEEYHKKGALLSIGTSNHLRHHLTALTEATTIKPAVNQIEIHPYLIQEDEVNFNREINVATESWSPLARGRVLSEPILSAIGAKYGKTPAQIVVRWHLQRDLIVIPKSIHKERIIENISVFDFTLSDEDMNKISALNRNLRTGSHPDFFKF